MRIEKPSLVNALATVLGDTVVLGYKVLGAHWNVVGADFHQNHAFFQMIYEDIDGSVDPIAENIRKLGAPAPFRLSDLSALSRIKETTPPPTFDALCLDILDANDLILSDISEAFSVANQLNEQGIANFLAERNNMHMKWRWQLSASLEGISGV